MSSLVTHEVYPGHHLDHVCKEPLLAEQARTELAIYLFPTPQAVVAEGIATIPGEVLLGVQAQQVAAEILRPLGYAPDPNTAAVVHPSDDTLDWVGSNVVQLVAEGGHPRDEARPYLRRWLIDPDEIIDKAATFYLDNPWPALRRLLLGRAGTPPAFITGAPPASPPCSASS